VCLVLGSIGFADKHIFATIGNLYYALTHAPEPLSEEYSYALSWKAATERFAAAGCIPEKEAELYQRWVESGDAGVEVSLPIVVHCKKVFSKMFGISLRCAGGGI